MILAAVFGAATASATTLKSGGTAGTNLGKGAVIEASLKAGTSSTLESGGFVEATCTDSTIKGSISNPGGSSATVVGSVSTANLTFTNCIYPTTVEEGGTLELHNIVGTDNGTLTGKGFRVQFHLPSGTCTYGAGEGVDLGRLMGATDLTGHATMEINATIPRVEGVFCPSDTLWTATYTVTNQTGLIVAPS
jgi:hypothetical protein